MFGKIYLVTNTVNGKQYVGQTQWSIDKRWRAHISYASSGFKSVCAFHSAIRKYGKDAFEITLLDTAETQEELNQKEITHISDLNTLAPHGYNLTSGGQGSPGRKASGWIHSEDVRKKMSQAQKGHLVSTEAREKSLLQHEIFRKKPEKKCLQQKPVSCFVETGTPTAAKIPTITQAMDIEFA